MISHYEIRVRNGICIQVSGKNRIFKSQSLFRVILELCGTLQQQLANGIRFFDVRFKPNSDTHPTKFNVYHGETGFQYIDGDGVFKDFRNFLKENPTETILFSNQEAFDPKDSKIYR